MANAVMTITQDKDNSGPQSQIQTVQVTVTFDNGNYITGGFVGFTAAALGLKAPIAGITILGCNTAGILLDPVYDSQALALKFVGTSGGTVGLAPNVELANSVLMGSASYTMRVWAKR
jgi:hypothetical protein